MNKFTHEHRLNEYLITLKAFIVFRYMYSQENLMYAPIHEYRLNERLYSNVHVHWNRLNADCAYTTKKKMLFVIGIHVPNMEI